ncbi:hypothetical protein Tco_1257314, partial [Tanacetum coccineum]
KMVEENVPAPGPTRSDEQILPFNAWAFIASTNVPTIYIQPFWNTLALEITLVDSAHPFVSPLDGDQVMDFVNELGYPEEIHFVSKMHVNNISAVESYSIFDQPVLNQQDFWQRPGSPVHVTGDDFLLGNLKFVPKGEKDEVFGKIIPKELITRAIQNSSYYQQYLEMVARKPTTKKVKEKTSKPTPSKKIRKGKVMKVRKEKRFDHFVDEEDEEPQSVSEPQIEDDEYNLQRGKGKGIATDEQIAQSLLELQQAKKLSTTDQYIFNRWIPVTQDAPTGPSAQPQDDTSANVVRDTPSPADAETGADTEKSNSEVALEERTVELDEGQARSDPGKTPESRPPPERVLMEEDQAGSNPRQSHVVLAGPNPEPTHEDFVATVYPQVHESLKHTTEEHVYIENPLSSFGTLSSMKNLDDAFTFGNHSYHQASSYAPLLSPPIIDLTPPKQSSPPFQEPIFTATTTTLLSPPPPPQQQSTTDPELAKCVSALEEICANLVKKNKLQGQTTQALSSRVFTLENHDLYSKIDKYVNEVVKEAVHNTHQAPIRERFKDLSEFEMKEILCDQIDDQYPSPPPKKDSNQSKKKRHDSDASALKQPPPQTSSTWKTSDTIDAPSSSSKQNPNSQSQEETPKTSEPDWIGKSKLSKADLEGAAFKVVRPFHKNNISLQFQMEECHLLLTDQIDLVNPEGNQVVPDVSKPLPLRGPPGQVTIQPQYFFNKDLEYLASGDKERRNALSISKLKAAYYPDFGLEELVSSLWIKSERKYDISVAYLKEIVLSRVDYKEYKISEVDFKNLHPNDFEDLYLLHLQGKLNHLSSAGKVHLFNAINFWDASDFHFKEDYTIVHKPKAVIYRDGNNPKKMMRETEVHKFSDGTLTRILEKLDHRVKDYMLFKFNPVMEQRIWS